jgi:hypothetical protein
MSMRCTVDHLFEPLLTSLSPTDLPAHAMGDSSSTASGHAHGMSMAGTSSTATIAGVNTRGQVNAGTGEDLLERSELVDDLLLALSTAMGENEVMRALELVDRHRVTCMQALPSGRLCYQVCG